MFMYVLFTEKRKMISWNLTKISTHSAHSDNFYFHYFVPVVWLSWNSFSNRCGKLQLSILKNKKVFFLKKYDLGCSRQQIALPIFSEGFGVHKLTIYSAAWKKLALFDHRGSGQVAWVTFIVVHSYHVAFLCVS